jgi:hypothetical protein
MHIQHLIFLLAFLVYSASAHIQGINPTLKTYHATSSSKYPLSFATAGGIDTYYDFSVAVGVHPSPATNPSGLGSFAENFDLIALGHGTTVG